MMPPLWELFSWGQHYTTFLYCIPPAEVAIDRLLIEHGAEEISVRPTDDRVKFWAVWNVW